MEKEVIKNSVSEQKDYIKEDFTSSRKAYIEKRTLKRVSEYNPTVEPSVCNNQLLCIRQETECTDVNGYKYIHIQGWMVTNNGYTMERSIYTGASALQSLLPITSKDKAVPMRLMVNILIREDMLIQSLLGKTKGEEINTFGKILFEAKYPSIVGEEKDITNLPVVLDKIAYLGSAFRLNLLATQMMNARHLLSSDYKFMKFSTQRSYFKNNDKNDKHSAHINVFINNNRQEIIVSTMNPTNHRIETLISLDFEIDAYKDKLPGGELPKGFANFVSHNDKKKPMKKNNFKANDKKIQNTKQKSNEAKCTNRSNSSYERKMKWNKSK